MNLFQTSDTTANASAESAGHHDQLLSLQDVAASIEGTVPAAVSKTISDKTLSPTSQHERVSFCDYVQKVYPFVNLDGEFHTAYYRVLEAFADGRIRRLIVTVPPQHGKSLGASTLLPAYMLGLNPEITVAIASYSASLANRFNKRTQRIMDSDAYRSLFPDTEIKAAGARSDYVRTADRVEVIGHTGELISVGREGALTGNRVDVFVIDDLYKDAMEANSPVVRENCWDWYTSVVETRIHNDSQVLIVFTRWHEEDLIGALLAREPFVTLEEWAQIDCHDANSWLVVNFEAVKASPPTEVDPRTDGMPLWPERHSLESLLRRRNLDPFRFECMYQGHPSSADGMLYGDNFATYDVLPVGLVRHGNYTDTADMGDDYLCSVNYAVDADRRIYITDVTYSRERMEVTEPLVAAMIAREPRCEVLVESNNGGRGFARAISRLCPNHSVKWFCQSANKEARILTNSAAVVNNIVMPRDWRTRWPDFAHHVVTYGRLFRSNRWHDAADVLTGIVERELTTSLARKIRALRFST